MKSLRRISSLLSVMMIIIVLGLITINIEMGDTNRVLSRLETANTALKSEIEKTNLPIRVLENIAGQEITTEDKRQTLQKAFDSNLMKSIGTTQTIDGLLLAMGENYDSLSSVTSIGRTVRQLYDKTWQFDVLNSQMQVLFTTLYESSEMKDQNSVDALEYNYNELVDQFQAYEEAYHEFALELRGNQLLFLNILIILLVLAVIMLLTLLIRLINNDLEVVKGTYRQIENHEFNVEDIWKSAPVFDEEKAIYEIVNRFFQNQNLISDFNSIVSNEYVIDEIIDKLLHHTSKIMGVDRVGIAFYDKSINAVVTEYGVATYDDIYLNVGYHSDLSTSSLRKVIEEKEGYINNDVMASFEANPDSTSMTLIIKEGIRSNMSVPLVINNEVFGVVFFSSMEAHHFTEENYELAKRLIYEITGALNRSYLMKVFMSRITDTFARLVDKKDIETGDHLNRMVRYSVAIAESLKEMNLDSHPIDNKLIIEIERNAAVHDIGKVGTPDFILKKPGKLTDKEFDIMRQHTNIGAEIFEQLNSELSQFSGRFFDTAEKIARYHHEKWDGSGYPEGLSGYDIPVVARIVALADVFDALTSKRVYKEAFSFERSLGIINDSSGSHFDPVVVKAFQNGLKKVRAIYEESHG